MAEERDDLTEALSVIARENIGCVSPRVEARLMAEFRAARPARRPGIAALGIGLAMAATLLVALAVPFWRVMVRGELMEPPPPSTASSTAADDARTATTAFLPLIYGALPTTDAQIVRIEVARAALASFGLAPIESGVSSVGPSDSAATVFADVIVGEDGLARAVRFVHPPRRSAEGGGVGRVE